ncbi:MAG TPA: M36 family metallopeptidase [Blastocatellia bacterium]|nr:M36 family metallopeptidase [Blastocatellia bacterium]
MAIAKGSKKSAKKSSRKAGATKAAQTRGKKKAGATKAAKPTARPTAAQPTMQMHPRLREQAFNAVPEDFHALYDRGFRAARGMAGAARPGETAGHRRLADEVKDVDVHYDSVTQLPKLVVSKRPTARLSGRAAGTAEGAVTEFIRSRGDIWNLSDDDLNTIEVVSVSKPGGEAEAAAKPARKRAGARAGAKAEPETTFNIGNLKTVNMIQRVEGKEVFNSDVTAAVNANNEVISVSGQFFPGAADSETRSRARAAGRAGATAESLAPEGEAIARAAFDLTNFPYEASEFSRVEGPPDSGPYRFYEYKPADNTRPPFTRPVRVKDLMFPLSEGQFVPAYYMELWIKGYPAFSYVMDAIDTPDLLYRRNLTSQVAFKYRVHNTGDAIFRPHDGPAPGTPHPTGKPDGFQAKTVKEKVITIESLLAGDPWLPPNAATTDGNNCIAYADLVSPDGFSPGDVMGKVTSPRTFNRAYDHSKPSSNPANLQNSLVGMFFHVNWLHDRWYEAGFDEASGNAQKENFGRGGIGGDPILAEGNDSSGTDNANMSTPADGDSPIMQMYEFVGCNPKPSRTSNHEALITFHEMGHYITNRLIGNANGLTNTQGRAMGEGWGDFFAICMTSQATDDFAKGVFAVGGWTDLTPSFNNNYYFSIRRYPYSADMAKNPLTFKHIGNNVILPSGPPINSSPAGNNEVHNAGEVWCAMLWEVFVNLVAKHGHAAAEKRVLAYVIGGLKLTPIRPTYTQARDGILSAVSALDPGDMPQVKAGFAKRGMGAGAVSPPANSSSLSGVVESFTP